MTYFANEHRPSKECGLRELPDSTLRVLLRSKLHNTVKRMVSGMSGYKSLECSPATLRNAGGSDENLREQDFPSCQPPKNHQYPDHLLSSKEPKAKSCPPLNNTSCPRCAMHVVARLWKNVEAVRLPISSLGLSPSAHTRKNNTLSRTERPLRKTEKPD